MLYDHLGDKWLAVGRDEGDDAELLWRLLAAAPRQDGRSAFTAAQFDAASLEGASGFGGATSRGAAVVDRPVLTGALRLWETVWAQ